MMRRQKVAAIVIALTLLLAGLSAASFVKVKTGTRVVCRYHHLVRQDITTAWVPRWRARDYGIRTTTVVCGKHKKLEALRREALAAVETGDVARAKQLFEDIKQVDPVFLDVNSQLDKIAAGTTGSTDNATGNGSTTQPATPKIDLTSLLPPLLTGFSAGEIEQGTGYAGRNYRPKSTARMQSLLISVHLNANLAAAEGFVDRVDRAGFPRNSKTTTVNGYSAYFGTDSGTYATLAWAQGPVAYEMQAHVTGGSPAGLEPDLVAIAAEVK